MHFSVPARADTESTSMIDLYTQRGGEGQNQSDGFFKPTELVILSAYLTNNSNPVSNKLVNFYIEGPRNPYNNITVWRTAYTNETGIATISFSIPSGSEYPAESILGTWYKEAKAALNEEQVLDTLTFVVGELVGSIYIPVNKLELLAPYFGSAILLAVTVAAVVFFRHKKKP